MGTALVPFRDLEWPRQFQLWQWIELEASPSKTDHRPESFTPNNDSIVVGDTVGTDNATWRTRLELISPSPARVDVTTYRKTVIHPWPSLDRPASM